MTESVPQEGGVDHQILIAGLGGQGVLFLTRLLYTAAQIQGRPAFTYEIHGMSQRGGSVYSSLKIGDYSSPVLFPGTVDTLFVLERSELYTHLEELRPDGMIVLNHPDAEAPEARRLAAAGYRLFVHDADADALRMGQPRIANLILLGRFMDERPFLFTREDIRAALRKIVKPALLAVNETAFLGTAKEAEK
jgi:indolepyruvate ferredoxin oxidoreductase beta subunit